MEKIKFTGKVDNIVFENNQNLFKIMDVEIIGTLQNYDEEAIRVTGNFGEIQLEGTYTFEGSLFVHPKFGTQFKVESYKQALPHEEGSLTKYLSSNKFPGIGKKAAQKIVAELGVNVLDIIKENPQKISTLSLTKKQKDTLLSGINSMDSYSEIILKLAKYGINKRVANNIYKTYHGDALSHLKSDPYEPVGSVTGYGFRTADKIGQELGIKSDDKRRIKGAVLQIIGNSLAQNGNTYVELENLLDATSELINFDQYDVIADEINELQKENKLVVSGETAALKNIFETELEIANELKRVIDSRKKIKVFSDKDISRAIKNAEKALKISYDDTQKQAIKNALNNSISVLTGGPGTGKTTIINGILLCLRELEDIPSAAIYSDDSPFLLGAPTGRAAKRMSEITGINSKTIHRLLGLGIGDSHLEVEELNQLNGEILIIDEMSMVDMFLFKLLLQGIQDTKRIVFVGDKDQLPSVGAGNIFGDLISSKAFPTTKLETIHRQGNESSIITLAHAINNSEADSLIFEKTKNYSFIPCDASQVGEAINQIVTLALKRGFDKDDIQVLGAMYNGPSGINSLNDIVQAIMNPRENHSKKIEAHGEVFRIGDRILQLQNNPEKDIYNGQIGKIIGINDKSKNDCLIANFDEREVKFDLKDLSDLTRAYAITIHKSQGSEFPLVILNLTMQNYMMLRRNLLYTAITRAESNLVMVGEKRAYLMALNTPGNNRKTGLTSKIRQILKLNFDEKDTTKKEEVVLSQETILTPELIYSGSIDPMIGMKNIKLEKRT
ncbi:ATP-dependent RecD-like DNA helicase [Lactobacillus sp.]|uniref:SF1B family DNA helicase RecD2 n=1 Tax=Lactobacillus sp. TaxID=1591 RepID=UPI00199D2681|nr:ATP-dependent RecD-like DNA helicase [Lactobacillus sp.]MBD5430072.1 ATP-dependent RecD-like DNA helicase [Lactobacillus sp.]